MCALFPLQMKEESNVCHSFKLTVFDQPTALKLNLLVWWFFIVILYTCFQEYSKALLGKGGIDQSVLAKLERM